jgi:hypothetical protein
MCRHLRFNLPVLRAERKDQVLTRGRVGACCCAHIAGGVKVNPLKMFTSLAVTHNKRVQTSWSQISPVTALYQTNNVWAFLGTFHISHIDRMHVLNLAVNFLWLFILRRYYHVHYLASDGRMIEELDLDENGHGIIEVLPQNLPLGTEENRENLSEDGRCPSLTDWPADRRSQRDSDSDSVLKC